MFRPSQTFAFRAAVAVLALHVVDDSFLQPPDGISAMDRLAGGLVPLALLALAATAYPRLRAGARGTVALVTGVLGLVMGASEAGYYTLNGGPTGDDWTGLLSLPAGLVLLGLGASVLWRSRRLTDRRSWRYGRRTLIGVVSVVAAFELVFPVALSYAFTHAARPDVPAADLGAAHEDVSFTTSDGLTLHGWYVPSRNGAAVIAFPGRVNPQPHTRMMAAHGYGVLLFDRRGEGESDGESNLLGWGGERDIMAAVEFLKRRPDVDPARIGGIGFSVGGELMLQAAAQHPGLAAVVSEGAGTRTLSEEVQEMPASELWPVLPLLAMKTAAMAVFSNTMPPPSLTSLVPDIAPRPVLLIWAPNGGNAETMNPVYRRLAGENASIWQVDDARHMRGLQARPAEYERRVVGFFDDALLGSGVS